MAQTIKKYINATDFYFGSAALGVADTTASWSIYKQVESPIGETRTLYPVGSTWAPLDTASFVWADRESYNYSGIGDTVAPVLTFISIRSSNASPLVAVPGDVITIDIIGDKYLKNVAGEILGQAMTATAGVDKLHWTLTYTMLSTDTKWDITFTVDFDGIDGTAGTQVTDPTVAKTIVFDNWAPIMVTAARTSNTNVRITFSENVVDATMTKANAGWFSAFKTGTPATTYAISSITKSGSNSKLCDLTIADISWAAATWVTITYTRWGLGTVADSDGNLLQTQVILAPAWA